MNTLTTILRRAGHLADDDVRRVAVHSTTHRCAPFVSVVELGLADEATLQHVLAARLRLSTVSEAMLSACTSSAAQAIPAALAWQCSVVPIARDGENNLTLAMADPTDERALRAVTDHTGAKIIRKVAPITPLRTTLTRLYGPAPEGVSLATPQSNAKPPRAPALQPLAHVLPKLLAAHDRDSIVATLLDYLSDGFSRVVSFTHVRGQLKGHDARGEDMLRDAVVEARIPTSSPSVFADVVNGGTVHTGPWPSVRPIDQAFARAMQGINGNVLLVPVKVGDKVPLVVFASGSAATVQPHHLAQLLDAAETALERLIARKRSTAPPIAPPDSSTATQALSSAESA